jgi:hypothetical protein
MLLQSDFDPKIGYFEVSMKRRHAHALRVGLFGPKGSRVVPKFDGNLRHFRGEMEFELPEGWLLHLVYDPPSPLIDEAGDVDAEFIPPGIREDRPQEKVQSAGEAHF